MCSKNKGADQLRGCREADLVFVLAYAKSRFSHEAAHIVKLGCTGVYNFFLIFALKHRLRVLISICT